MCPQAGVTGKACCMRGRPDGAPTGSGGHRAGRRARSAESTRLLRGRGKGDVPRIASGIVRRPVVSGSVPEPEKRGAPVIGDPTPPTVYRAAPVHTCRYDA